MIMQRYIVVNSHVSEHFQRVCFIVCKFYLKKPRFLKKNKKKETSIELSLPLGNIFAFIIFSLATHSNSSMATPFDVSLSLRLVL